MNENYRAQLSSPGTNETEYEKQRRDLSVEPPPSPALWPSGVKGWRWEEGRVKDDDWRYHCEDTMENTEHHPSSHTSHISLSSFQFLFVFLFGQKMLSTTGMCLLDILLTSRTDQ